jgi:hypothetical protein
MWEPIFSKEHDDIGFPFIYLQRKENKLTKIIKQISKNVQQIHLIILTFKSEQAAMGGLVVKVLGFSP